MRISRVELHNFRCFKELVIESPEHLVLVGRNNSGKSVVLTALEKFFTSHPKRMEIGRNDFHINSAGEASDDLFIDVEFCELSESAVEQFSHYGAVNKLKLRLSAYNSGEIIAARFNYFRNVIVDFAPVAAAKSAADKFKEYQKIQPLFPDLPDVKNGTAALAAIQEYERSRPSECSYLISEENAGGTTGPIKDIEKFLQWILIPAVKDAATESQQGKNSLAKLVSFLASEATDFESKTQDIIENAKAEFNKVVEESQSDLLGLSSSLNNIFGQITSSEDEVDLTWTPGSSDIRLPPPIASAYITSGPHRDRIEFFGHGLQRNYIVSLLQLLADVQSNPSGSARTLILGFEEPELYQHPPQARALRRYIDNLLPTNQIILTTHSSHFIRPSIFDEVLLIRNSKHGSTATAVSKSKYLEKYFDVAKLPHTVTPESAESSLVSHLSYVGTEVFFSPYVVLVEGVMDVIAITEYLDCLGLADEANSLGVTIIPTNNKGGLLNYIALCSSFSIPHYVVFDADYRRNEDGSLREPKDDKWNLELCELFGFDHPLSSLETLQSDKCTAWAIDLEDVVKCDCSDYEARYDTIRETSGLPGRSKRKNIYVFRETLRLLYSEGLHFESLKKLCNTIIDSARSSQSLLDQL